MQNLDVTSIASLADTTLDLVINAPDCTEEQFSTKVQQWTADTVATIKALGVTNKVQVLKEQFMLDEPTTALILYALLPSLDSRYAHFFEKLNDDPKKSLPTIDLLETLVTTTYQEKNQFNAQLEDNSPIFYWRMLIKKGEQGFLSSTAQPGKDLVLHFAEENRLENDLTGLVSLITEPKLNLAFDKVEQVPAGKIISINGGFDARQSSFAFKLANDYHKPLYTLNNEVLKQAKNPVEELREALLFVVLNDGILYWQDGSQTLASNPEYPSLLNAWLALKGTRLIIGETQFHALPESMDTNPADSIQLSWQNQEMNQLIWQSIGEKHLGVTAIDYKAINNRYTTNYLRILETVLRVKQLQQEGVPAVTTDMEKSYVATSPVSIANLAYLDITDFSYADLILPATVQNDIITVEKAYLNRVFLDPAQPSGVITIFEGAVGTGKTMAAECLANSLGIPVYKIDYARLLDNSNDFETTLNQLFVQAEQNSACLLFDEADALFAKKSKDPTNPHNLLIAYLIQRIEKYNGLIILTTNQKVKIDKAIFLRAMIVITFPAFKPQQRYDLFLKILANMGVTVDSKVNLANLMHVLNANGKQIKNIINNAVLSASDGTVPLDEIVIAAKDLGRAINLERNK